MPGLKPRPTRWRRGQKAPPYETLHMPSIKADRWIKKMALEHGMIEPFEDRQVRDGVVSYGLSSYGYDIRVADEFKIFTNINSTVVVPVGRQPIRHHPVANLTILERLDHAVLEGHLLDPAVSFNRGHV